MKISKFALFKDYPECGREISKTIFSGIGKMRIETIASNRCASPDGFWYDQPEDELAAVLAGSGVIDFDIDGRVETLALNAYECVIIPKHTLHRVTKTSEDCLWLCAFVDAAKE